MPLAAVGATPEPVSPRLVVVRSFADLKALVAMLQAGLAVLVVFRADDADRQRASDLLTGWALGSGGSLDRISANTVVARPPGVKPVHLRRTGIVSAVEEAFGEPHESWLSPGEEQQLLLHAASGDIEARRRLLDSYTELVTLLALWLRPPAVSQARAVRLAHEELDRLVTHPPRGPLPQALVEAITSRWATA